MYVRNDNYRVGKSLLQQIGCVDAFAHTCITKAQLPPAHVKELMVELLWSTVANVIMEKIPMD